MRGLVMVGVAVAWFAMGAGIDGRSEERAAAVAQQAAAPDAGGMPLLQQAMLRRDRGEFRKLLAAGANPAQGNIDGQTALHLAAMGEDPYWLDQLLERGVDPNLSNTITAAPPLFDALFAARPNNVDRLLAAGARLDVHDRTGNTPLHQAAKVNDLESVLKFLEAGADPDATNRIGVTFQRYLGLENPKLRNAATRRNLRKIDDWLRANGVRSTWHENRRQP